jgi:hypothetical protein
MTTPIDEELDRTLDLLVKTNGAAILRRLKAAAERDRRGGPVGVTGYPTGQGGAGPTNAVSRPTESAALATYRTAREDPAARVCPNGCTAPTMRVDADDLEPDAPLEPGIYCTGCGSTTVARDADGPQGGGYFADVRDPLHEAVSKVWHHAQALAVHLQAVVDGLAKIDELGEGAVDPAKCDACERAGRIVPANHLRTTAGGRLTKAEDLCGWHFDRIRRKNLPIAERGPDVRVVWPDVSEVHRRHDPRTTAPAAKRPKAKPVTPDVAADIADRRRKRITTPTS